MSFAGFIFCTATVWGPQNMAYYPWKQRFGRFPWPIYKTEFVVQSPTKNCIGNRPFSRPPPPKLRESHHKHYVTRGNSHSAQFINWRHLLTDFEGSIPSDEVRWHGGKLQKKTSYLEHVLSATLRLKWGNMRILTCICGQSWWCVGIWRWRNKRKVIPTKLAFTFQEVGKCVFSHPCKKKKPEFAKQCCSMRKISFPK